MKKLLLSAFIFFISICAFAQDELSRPLYFGVQTGMMNYEGDLNPTSFSFKHSHSFLSFYLSQQVTSRVSLRGGVSAGQIEASDKWNRGYLVPRNLDFKSDIQEMYGAVEFSFLNADRALLNPYVMLGGAVFHFNPWTNDAAGNKVYLQPLGTEGQGLAEYPSRKLYNLTQFALVYAGGIKYTLGSNVIVGIEGSMRRTFTDYLDDVSASYADHDKLLAARGQQAVDLAFRGDELAGNQAYPHAGEQRGTPTENDWYYTLGVNLQVRISAIGNVLANSSNRSRRLQGCPVNF
jgi:hypothetical protein